MTLTTLEPYVIGAVCALLTLVLSIGASTVIARAYGSDSCDDD